MDVGYDFWRCGEFGFVVGSGGGWGEDDFAVRVGEEGVDLRGLVGCGGVEGALFGGAVGAVVGGGGDGFGDWFGHLFVVLLVLGVLWGFLVLEPSVRACKVVALCARLDLVIRQVKVSVKGRHPPASALSDQTSSLHLSFGERSGCDCRASIEDGRFSG